MTRGHWISCGAIVLLAVLPFWLGGSRSAAFVGADELARLAIVGIAPGYVPWAAPLIEPASTEIAALLFALQAAIGAGALGFWLGWSLARERAAAAITPMAKAPHAD